MADLLLQNCATESDLGQLAQGVLNQASKVRDDLLKQIRQISTSDEVQAVLNLNQIYDRQIAPSTNDQVSSQIGLPSASPTELEDESRLEPLGLVMVKGILYARGTNQNIEEFRRLFFAVGSNVSLFLSLVNSAENLVVVQTRLLVRQLPRSQPTWSLAQARTALQNDAIEAVYLAGDGATYVIEPIFLSVNKSLKQTALETGLDESEIVTQVFWLREVETTSARINQLVALGLDSDERTSILTDQAIKSVRPTAIETLRASVDQSIRRTLDQMSLLNQRFAKIDPPVKEGFRSDILKSIEEARGYLFELEQKVRFQPVLIPRPDDIKNFLELNQEADLSYLFALKRTVKAIDFTVSREELMRLIRQASAIPAGSNTVSSILSNQLTEDLDQDINQTNEALALVQCGLFGLRKKGDLRFDDMQTAYGCLSSIKLRPTTLIPSSTPVIGYASFDSPSSILFRRADLAATLKINNIFEEIVNLAKPISAVVEQAIRVFIEMIKGLRRAVEQALDPLIANVKKIVADAEAFLSRHASYFGTASLDSSVLKCALNLDLQPKLPFLDDVAPFLEILKRKLKNILALISQIVGDFLNKVLCLPINFLNDLLKGVTNFLPSFCKNDTFKLPPELEAALMELQQGFQLESTTFQAFARNLLGLQAEVQGLPAKLEQFQESLICNETPLNSRFMTVFRKDVDVSLGKNPLGQVAKLIPPRG